MISGWKGGCLPVNTHLDSTLECFYNSNCLNIIIESNNKIPKSLNKSQGKYSISTNVLTLLSKLFIEQWNSTFSYKNYIKKCSPFLCTYSYEHRSHFIQIVTTFFSVIGGLYTGIYLFVQQIILRLLIWKKKRKRKRQITPHFIHQFNHRKSNFIFSVSLQFCSQCVHFSNSFLSDISPFKLLLCPQSKTCNRGVFVDSRGIYISSSNGERYSGGSCSV